MTSTLQVSQPARVDAPRKPEAPPRDPWFDNAKMLLVTSVVVGHAWTLLPDSPARHWFYDFLYLWHMPALVVVTGYLSRSFRWSARHLSRLATSVLLPYLLFEALMTGFRLHVGGEDGIDRIFLEPHWPMWFLAALLLWRLATPLLRRTPCALPLSVGVSLLGGLLAGDVLDLGRVTGMLPFFVLGLVARPEHLHALRRPSARRAALVLLAAAFVAAYFIDTRMRTEWLYWRSGYEAMGATFWEGAALRLGLIAAAVVLSLAALSLVPRHAGWFTRLGSATMVVYLCHGFFVKLAEYAGAPSWAEAAPWPALAVTTTAAILLALGLAAPPVARRLSRVVDPVGALRRTSRTSTPA